MDNRRFMGGPPNQGRMFPLVGGGPVAASPGPSMRAALIPRNRVQNAMYQAAAAISQAKGEILSAIALLTDTHAAALQTVEHTKSSDGLVDVGGVHITTAQFAERFRMSRQEDVDAVAKALELLRESAARLDIAEVEKLAYRG